MARFIALVPLLLFTFPAVFTLCQSSWTPAVAASARFMLTDPSVIVSYPFSCCVLLLPELFDIRSGRVCSVYVDRPFGHCVICLVSPSPSCSSHYQRSWPSAMAVSARFMLSTHRSSCLRLVIFFFTILSTLHQSLKLSAAPHLTSPYPSLASFPF
jgi:hypothetical protein